jgi:hypothetical protein
MKRLVSFLKEGMLVKTRYSLEVAYGITTSRVEYHAPRSTNHCIEYVWVLWNNGEHELYKVDMLEVISESR